MKWGLTTGTCAALATKAATLLLVGKGRCREVTVTLPDGAVVSHPVHDLNLEGDSASATVVKDAGDDPDVTHGTELTVTVKLNRLNRVRFFAGQGVGTVTRPGLTLPPGEAAINPGPRRMISEAIGQVTERGVDVTVAVPRGLELAEKTFNPRLGITGGISILGTTGRVRPFSASALRESLKCALDVAVAEGQSELVLAPGNMGNGAALHYFDVRPEQIVDVSNEWGYMLEAVEKLVPTRLLIVGHPGKLGKLAMGQWQTHSSRSTSAVPFIAGLGRRLGVAVEGGANTVEELFMSLSDPAQRDRLGAGLAAAIADRILSRYPGLPDPAIALINLERRMIGRHGDLDSWRSL